MRRSGSGGANGGLVVPAIVIGVCALLGFPLDAQPPRARAQKADTLRDSAMVRVSVNMDSLERMIRELLASRELEKAIGISLNEAARGQHADSRRVKKLSDSMHEIARRNAGLMTKIEMECTGLEPLPSGYLGVLFDQQSFSQRDNEPALFELGTIQSVAPGSPAERAGLQRGDLLLSIGGVDARKPIALGTLLKPGAKLQMRLQRGKTTRDVTVMVEKRPSGFGSDCATVEQVISPASEAPVIIFHKEQMPRASVTPRPGVAIATPSDVLLPQTTGGSYAYGYSSMVSSGIAGANMMPLDDDWRQSLGVDNGLLVMKVLPGTSAKDAGLHGMDVIISADGQSVGSVRALQRIISNAKGNSVKLQVVRGGKTQTLTLRWQEHER